MKTIIALLFLFFMVSCLDADSTYTIRTDTTSLETFQCLSGEYQFCDCTNTTDERILNTCDEEGLW